MVAFKRDRYPFWQELDSYGNPRSKLKRVLLWNITLTKHIEPMMYGGQGYENDDAPCLGTKLINKIEPLNHRPKHSSIMNASLSKTQKPFSPGERAKLRRLMSRLGDEADAVTKGPFSIEEHAKLQRLIRRAVNKDRRGFFSPDEHSCLRSLLDEFLISENHRIGLRQVVQLSLSRPNKINLGSGSHPKDGFLNIDFFPGNNLTLDLRRDLPFETDCCELIFSEHFFEHLDYPNPVRNLISECLRVLKPGGLLRFSVPDTEWPLTDYHKGNNAEYFRACRKHSTTWHPAYCTTRLEHINYHFRQNGEHRFAYDEETIRKVLEDIGFCNVQRVSFDSSIDAKHRETGSLFISAQKNVKGRCVNGRTIKSEKKLGGSGIVKAAAVFRKCDQSVRIETLITCVNYSDFLHITLPVTKKFFNSITVVTSPNDVETLSIAKQHGANTHITDIWNKNGAKFNKSGALNECLDQINNRGDECWILLLDADILFSENILQDVRKLDKRGLYSVKRRLCESKQKWDKFSAGNLKWTDFPIYFPRTKDNKIWSEQITTNPAGLCGYIQLWNLKHSLGMKRLPNSNNAAAYDVEFALSFPETTRSFLNDHEVLHLGPPQENWNGRLSKRWF